MIISFCLMDKKGNCVTFLCILQQDTSKDAYYRYSYCYHDLSISFSIVPLFLPLRRHTSPFIASPDLKFFCFISLSSSFSHFASGRPRRSLPSGDQVIIRLGHLLSSMRTTRP